MWLLARVSGRRAATGGGSGTPWVSVIVASRDEAVAVRARALDARASNYATDRLEVIVARDAARSYSDADDLADLPPEVRVIAGDAPGGKAASLNAAVRAARGDVLVFTDTAQRFEPNAIARLVAALSDERIGAVSGALRVRESAERGAGGHRSLAEMYWAFERWLRAEEARVHSTVGVTGAIYAMRRGNWRPLPTGVLCDDLYIPMELVLRGFRIGFRADAQARDDRRFEAAQEYQRKVRTLTGVLQVCLWLPAVLLPVRNPIWLQFVFHKLLRLLTPYLVFVGAAAGVAAVATSFTLRSTGAGIAVALIALGIAAALWAFSARARSAFAMGVAMQLAVMRATWNGLRGHWDVWRG